MQVTHTHLRFPALSTELPILICWSVHYKKDMLCDIDKQREIERERERVRKRESN